MSWGLIGSLEVFDYTRGLFDCYRYYLIMNQILSNIINEYYSNIWSQHKLWTSTADSGRLVTSHGAPCQAGHWPSLQGTVVLLEPRSISIARMKSMKETSRPSSNQPLRCRPCGYKHVFVTFINTWLINMNEKTWYITMANDKIGIAWSMTRVEWNWSKTTA